VSFGSVQIVVAPRGRPPFPVNAVAAEEDTFLVLSADPVVRAPREPLIKLLTKVIETRPEIPGTVLVKGKDPLRLLAIVHDLNLEPSWREEWIASTLDEIFKEAECRRLHAIALPFLGTRHGSLKVERFVALLRRALERMSPSHPKRLWLVTPDGTNGNIFETIEAELQQ